MTEAEVLEGVRFLTDTGYRPSYIKAGAKRWLDNFEAADRTAAVALLDSFLLVPNKMTDALVVAAFNQLAPAICAGESPANAPATWARFRDDILVTFPTGEIPNPTDSGYSFQRAVRQLLRIEEQQIVEPADAIQALASRGGGSVVFVDDFVGSGHQFVETWTRQYDVPGLGPIAFSDVSPPGVAYYVPLVCTTTGYGHIKSACPTVELMPLHLLGDESKANHASSRLWDPLAPSVGIKLVEKYTTRAGYEFDHRWGYENLALAFAFEHGTPDATLPILYSERLQWRPLVRRR